VVPITVEPLGAAYALLLGDLESRMRQDFAWAAPEPSFAAYVFAIAQDESPLPPVSTFMWPTDARLVHAPALAAAGYWLASGLADALRTDWLDGIERLSRRDAFPSDRQSFVHRPVELLGVAAGIKACAGDRSHLVTWLRGILDRLRREDAGNAWSANLRLAAEALVLRPAPGIPSRTGVPQTLVQLALSRWLRTGILSSKADKEEEAALLAAGLTATLDQCDVAQAAVIYQSLRSAVRGAIRSAVDEHWHVNRTQRDAEELVIQLCRRFHLFAQQIRLRHDSRPTVKVKDEYDVQDLMHALLRLHFDDVRPEEVTPSVGGKSGRMDFLLKRERMTVETKMTRKTLKQKQVGDELIVDMGRYRAHPDCRTLICFVYDPEGFCDTPTALEDDLTRDDGRLRTRVVVSPKGT
jgi:hypothetical protein